MTRLSQAGISGERVLRSVAASAREPLKGALTKTAGLVGNGMLLSTSGHLTGIFSPRDRQLVSVGEQSGNVDHVFGRLAHYYRARVARARRVKAKLAYPAFLLVGAVFIAPFPALFVGAITVGGYLSRTLVPLIVLGVLVWLVGRWMTHLESSESPTWMAYMLLSLPFIKELVKQHARTEVLESLALFLSSGLAAHQSVSAAIDAVSNSVLKARFRQARVSLETGKGVADALRDGDIIDPHAGYAIVSTGEQAGRLDAMISRHASAQSDQLDTRYDDIAEWLPRFIYCLVVALVVSQIF